MQERTTSASTAASLMAKRRSAFTNFPNHPFTLVWLRHRPLLTAQHILGLVGEGWRQLTVKGQSLAAAGAAAGEIDLTDWLSRWMDGHELTFKESLR